MRTLLRDGCLILVIAPPVLLVVIQICFSTVNALAFNIAERECATQPQVEVVDHSLWNKAAAAAVDPDYPNRRSYAFDISGFGNFNELRRDPFVRALYRAKNPVKVQGKIVAYAFNTYVYIYTYGAILAPGLPDYHCLQNESKFSKEIVLISSFNKLGER
jgi:hypothetical protein